MPLVGKEAERRSLTATVDGARWQYDSEEEFFADFRRSASGVGFQLKRPGGELDLYTLGNDVTVMVMALGRSQIEAISAVFEQAAVDIVNAFLASALFNDIGDHGHEVTPRLMLEIRNPK